MPLRSAIPATVRLADAPIRVPLPPRHAPSESAHHSGINPSGPPKVGAIALIIGIIVATNGMLSTIAKNTADDHMTPSRSGLPVGNVVAGRGDRAVAPPGEPPQLGCPASNPDQERG